MMTETPETILPGNSVGAASHKAEEWHSIDWAKAHRLVRRLQARIVKATQEQKWGKVKACQVPNSLNTPVRENTEGEMHEIWQKAFCLLLQWRQFSLPYGNEMSSPASPLA